MLSQQGFCECLPYGQHLVGSMEDTKGVVSTGGRMNDPVAVITGTVYSAVTLCKPCAKGVAYIVSFNNHTTSSRAEEATEAWRGEATCPKLPSKWAAKPEPASLTPVSQMETVIARFLSHKNQFSPDNRFHHSWNCTPGKKEDCLTVEANACPSRRRVLGGPSASLSDPHVTSICLTSDSERLVQPVCNPDSRTSPDTNQIVILGLGRIRVIQSCSGYFNLSIFTHCMRWHIENMGSMGIGGVKQTVRSWVWESRRQTMHVLLPVHTHQGLFQPDPAKVIEAENKIQNPFSWAGSFGFSSFFCLFVFNTHIVSLGRNVSGEGEE